MKTIDVMEGDTWTIGPDRGVWIYQYRGGKWRGLGPESADGFWCGQAKLNGEVDLSEQVALAILRGYGYTLTPAAKPEAKPVVDGACNKCGHVGPCTDDRGIFRHNRKDGTPCPYSATPSSHHAEAKPADVPVVDAVWVEVTANGGVKYLNTYPSREEALRVWGDTSGQRMEEGRARIVRIRSDDADDDSIKNISDVLYRLDKQVQALESRLAAEKTDRPLWVNRYDAPTAEEIRAAVDLAKQLRAERDKPAARVVKAPTADGMHTPVWWQGWRDADAAWRTALASQGIKVEAAE